MKSDYSKLKVPRQRIYPKPLTTGVWYITLDLKRAHMYAQDGIAACGVPLPENTETMEIGKTYPEHKKCKDCLYHEEIGK